MAGLGAVVLLAGIAAAAPASAAPSQIKVVQHNTDQQQGRWLNVLSKGGNNDALFAQEVCEKWVEDAEKAHPGWTFSFHRQKRTTADNAATVCPPSADGKTWKGPVAAHTGAGSATRQDRLLHKSGGQRFGLACVVFTQGGRKVHGCATHLQVYGDKDLSARSRQTGEIRRITGGWIEDGHSVVVGGDFNLVPTRSPMTKMYQPNGNGRFVEAHQLMTGSGARTGVPTAFGKDDKGRKIDYVFFSANRTPLQSGGSLEVTPVAGGHAILKAKATIR